MGDTVRRVVIVGAGQAGGGVARTLRDEGFDGSIVLVGDEPHPPYERPPLSKAVLLGSATAESTYLFRGDSWDRLAVDFRCKRSAVALDRRNRTIGLADGTMIAFDRLVLATGGRPTVPQIPGGEHALLLRSIADGEALRTRLLDARRLAVVGGGWIGLEVAAAARSLGIAVSVIEVAERLCARAAHPALSAWLRALHRQRGVDLHLGVGVAAIDPTGVLLADGHRIAAELVVAGVGMTANDRLARDAGLAVDGGILTDPCGRTDAPAIFACGDVSVFEHPLLRRRVRLESWANAHHQSIACARALLGRPATNAGAPWFWSDQYGVNIQMVGWVPPEASLVARGTPADGKGSWHALAGNLLTGAIAINAGRDIKAAGSIIERGTAVDAATIADTAADLRRLIRP